MKLATISKWLTLGGGSISAAAAAGSFGQRWSPVFAAIGGASVAIGAAVASQTSAGHPNGERS